MADPTIFLLSPAHCGGRRAATLFRSGASFDLARRVRVAGGAPLGEVFSYLSGLYFRGKLIYATHFSRAPMSTAGVQIITSSRGLLAPSARIKLDDLAEFAEVEVDPANPRYADPLLADLRAMAAALPTRCRIVLLGSIATSKYVDPLSSVFGDRLCFPESFIGIGDMSRGAILLRSAAAGVELTYQPATGALRSRAVARRLVP